MGSVKKKRNDLGLRPVRAKEIRELSKLAWVHDETLSTERVEARVLPDGRVLFVSSWVSGRLTGCVVPSRAAAEEVKRSFDEVAREVAEQSRRGVVDSSLNLLPPIDDFLRDVEAHAKSLGPRLRIPDEVLDFTPASLDAVDKALKRILWAKREVPDLVTPLVAYLGEVIRRATGGQWSKSPTTRKLEVPIYDPVEEAAWAPLYWAAAHAGNAAADRAAAEARARRASRSDVATAANMARSAAYVEVEATRPKPLRFEVIELPIEGHENEPMITTRGGGLFQPFASVFIPIHEPSKRIPLRSADGVPYPPSPRP